MISEGLVKKRMQTWLPLHPLPLICLSGKAKHETKSENALLFKQRENRLRDSLGKFITLHKARYIYILEHTGTFYAQIVQISTL